MTNGTNNDFESGSDFSPLEAIASVGKSASSSTIVANVKIASQIGKLLVEHGIPLRKHRSYVAKVLGVSYPAARRILMGETSWTDNDITTVLRNLGLDWSGITIVKSGTSQDVATPSTQPQITQNKFTCTIEIDGLKMSCEVFESLRSGMPPVGCDALCLKIEDNGEASIVRSRYDEDGDRSKLRKAGQIQIFPEYSESGARIAILDDDRSVSDGLAMRLAQAGFRADPFSSPEELVARCKIKPAYEAFLLDWSLNGGKDISEYIAELREAAPYAPMVLMSGLFDSESIDQQATRLAQQYDLSILTKPSPAIAIIDHLLLRIKIAKKNEEST